MIFPASAVLSKGPSEGNISHCVHTLYTVMFTINTDFTNDCDVLWPWDRAAAVWADFIPEQQFIAVCFASIHY